jgi:hypothetical protein
MYIGQTDVGTNVLQGPSPESLPMAAKKLRAEMAFWRASSPGARGTVIRQLAGGRATCHHFTYLLRYLT